MFAKAAVEQLLKLLRKDPRPALFGFRAPGIVRAGALLGIEERDETDFLVRHAGRDVELFAARTDLLEDWQADGHWGISRLLMKSKGERAAHQAAVRQGVTNLSLLAAYGYQLKADHRLGRFCEFARGQLFGPSLKRGRISLQAAYFAALLAGNSAANLIPNKIAALLKQAHDHPEDVATSSADEVLRRFSTSVHALFWRHAMGEDVAVAAADALKRAVDTGIADYPQLDRLRTPAVSINRLHLCRLAVLAGFDDDHSLSKYQLEPLLNLQQKNGLWASVRSEPFPDEDLFLTLEATLVIKAMIDIRLRKEAGETSENAED